MQTSISEMSDEELMSRLITTAHKWLNATGDDFFTEMHDLRKEVMQRMKDGRRGRD